MSPVPLSVSRVQTAISNSFGTPNCRSTRDSSAACACISFLARLMRAGTTRVAAYSSKLLRKVLRWRRSKVSTAWSIVTPAKAWSTTERETPAACASRAMADRKVWKSPPHWAAWADGTKGKARKTKAMNLGMNFDMTEPALPRTDVYTVMADLSRFPAIVTGRGQYGNTTHPG